MLILTKSGSPALVHADIAADAAQSMIDAGEAVEVTRLQVLRDIRIASAAAGDHIVIEESGSVLYPKVIEVPKDIDEKTAKDLLRGYPNATPLVAVLDEFKPAPAASVAGGGI